MREYTLGKTEEQIAHLKKSACEFSFFFNNHEIEEVDAFKPFYEISILLTFINSI